MPEKLNVCLINDSFPPLIDGVANTVKNYAAIIEKNYGKATVAVPYYPGADDSLCPYKVVRFPSLNTERLLNYRAGYPFSPETLDKIKEENIDVIHTHCPFMSAILARTLREPLDAPVIFTYHTKFDIDIARTIGNNVIKEKVLKQLVKNIEACDEVWVVSEGAGENLRSIGYKGEYVVMENGVDIPKGRVPDEKIAEATAGYDLPEGIPVFLFVGRMAWYKGLDIILEALANIKAGGDDFRMVFIGGGLDKEEVEKYSVELGLSEKCIFTGPIHDREVIRAWYCRADLFLFPSVYDTNGLVVREAAACGLGSVLIKGSCAAEGITDGETGFVCENSAKAFGEKLHEICKNPESMKIVGKNAMDKIYVSWEDSVAKAVERYKIVLKNYRAGKYENKRVTLGEEWLRAEGELLDGINRARAYRRNFGHGMKYYGKEMIQGSVRAAESFKRRSIKLKNITKEKSAAMKNAIREKLDRYL
ncbi:MAG: glycosyltransferase [Oscillospiraceae bacterium]|nr:glycosyltransferase [Oscillospiraceae bacterium]